MKSEDCLGVATPRVFIVGQKCWGSLRLFDVC